MSKLRINELESLETGRALKVDELAQTFDYEAGIKITSYSQMVRDGNGEFWRVSGQFDLPYVTTGSGLPEGDALVPAGDAVLRQDLANPDKGAAMVAYRNTTVASKLEDIEVTPEDFGAVGDGVTDDSAAFVAMMNSRPELSGFTVKLGAKTYKLNSTALYFTRRIKMCGVSRNVTILDFSECTKVVNFPYNSHIVVVHDRNIAGTSTKATPIEIPEGWMEGYGEMCELSNFSVICNSDVVDGNGVFFNVATDARNLLLIRANLHGAVICGSSGNLLTMGGTRGPTGVDIGGNSNNGVYTNIKASSCGGDGIHVNGSDANANLFLHADAGACSGWGINDASLLGNTYVQPHTAGNKYGAYRVRPESTNRSCFLGAYTEGNQGGDNDGKFFELNSRATFLGATGAIPRGDFPAMTNEYMGFVFRKDIYTADAGESVSTAPESRDSFAFMGKGRLGVKTTTGKLLEIKRLDSGYTGLFYGGQEVIRFSNNEKGAITGNRPFFFNGFALSEQHSQTVSNAAPSTGFRRRGEIVWATNPVPGGYVGWVCTTSGDPGTWKRFGAIEA